MTNPTTIHNITGITDSVVKQYTNKQTKQIWNYSHLFFDMK